jgi:hypothetical protein
MLTYILNRYGEKLAVHGIPDVAFDEAEKWGDAAFIVQFPNPNSYKILKCLLPDRPIFMVEPPDTHWHAWSAHHIGNVLQVTPAHYWTAARKVDFEGKAYLVSTNRHTTSYDALRELDEQVAKFFS